MKKKFDFLDKFKSKIRGVFQSKKNKNSEDFELEDDETEEGYEFEDGDELSATELSDEEYEDGHEDEYEYDDDYIPQQMTINRDAPDSSDRTQEMKRPSSVELSSTNTDHSKDEIDEESYVDDDDDGEVLENYQEFKVQSKPSANKFGAIQNFFSKASFSLKSRLAKNESKTKGESPSTTSMNWDEFIQQVFHVDSRPKVHRFFIILIVAIGTYGLGKIVATVVEGQNTSVLPQARNAPIYQIKQQDSNRDLQIITRADLFNTQQKDAGPVAPIEAKPSVDENLICLAAQSASNLPISIKHTTVLQDSVKSVASVQVRGQKDILDIREGQKINNMAEIGKIDRQKVILKNLSSGACEFIQLDEEKGARAAQPIKVVSEEVGRQIMKNAEPKGIRNEGNSFAIEKGLRDKMLSNISEVLTQARAVQIQNPDGSLAFKMTEIVPGSIYSQLNIQDGDIIEGINGDKITDLNAIMSMFGKIREIDNLSLTIKRNGTTRNFDYKFE